VSVVGAVYLVGYMQWSVAWLITPVILSVLRDQWRKESEYRRNLAKAAAQSSEKDVIHGMVRVVMKPLITKMPLVGGLQIFFLNNPSIDFNLVGVADVLDMPGFSDILRRCIVEQIANMMVLPNKLPIKLSDEIPTVDLRMPEPEGVLRIHLVKAENLMKKDVSMLGKGKSDPYAILTVGAQQWKTKHIDNNVNPRWDFWCEVVANKFLFCLRGTQARIMHSMGQALEIEVFDKDEGNDDDKLGSSRKSQVLQCDVWDWDPGMGIQNDDFLGSTTRLDIRLFDWDRAGRDENLGRCSLDISQVVRFGRLDTVQTLQQAKHGKVHMRLSWHRLTTDVTELSRALTETLLIKTGDVSSAVLSVYIDSCKKLPVLDQKTGNSLGQLTYSISALLKQKDLTMLTQPLMMQKSGPESKIIMSLQLK
ncbi:putative ca2+-dependent phospholipid-binding protein synaptotagmin required for synaptic vesicle, partial [Operophtera brumata]